MTSLRWAALMSLGLALGCSGAGSRTGDGGVTPPGSCSPVCSSGQSCCSSGASYVCASFDSDPNNCGSCGVSCGGGSCVGGVCTGVPDGGGRDTSVGPGMCSPSCSSSQRCCGTSCSNRQAPAGMLDGRSDTSFSNCNGCGLACDTERASVCGQQLGGSGPPQCLCGNFAQCPVGQRCVSNGGTFTCADLSSDPNNCGEVGTVCGEGESCVGGVCGCGGTGAACVDGQACCGGACVDVTSDAANCGACGTACSAGETCAASSCGCGDTGVACSAPTAGGLGGGGDPGESCCGGACVPNNDTSCACEPCSGGDTCQVGGSGFLPGGGGGGAQVCCGGSEVALLGCGGFGGGDGGLPFP